MKKIEFSIPKPCHEDWNKMSPQEKGRFCDKCAKTVLDFTSDKNEEIQKYLASHKGERMCGRFRNDQLKMPVQIRIFYRSIASRLSYQNLFLFCLLIVFGTTLFSCTTHSDHTVGEFVVADTTSVVPEQIKTPDTIIEHNGNQILKGEVSYPADIIIGDKGPKPAGSIAPEFPADTIDLPEFDVWENSISVVYTTVGLVVQNIDFICPPPDTGSTMNSSDINPDIAVARNNFSVIYPNPAHAVANLKLSLTEETNTTIQLFDLNGKLIKTLLESQVLPVGEREIRLDLSGLPAATYMVRLVKNGAVESKRVVVM